MRLLMGCFVAVSLLLAMLAVPPAMAGSSTAPEVSDSTGDFLLATTPTQVQGTPVPLVPPTPVPMPSQLSQAADIKQAWVAENGTAFFFNVQAAGKIQAGFTPSTSPTDQAYIIQVDFHFTVNGTDKIATVTATQTGLAASGQATAVSANAAGDVLNLTVPREKLAGLHAGSNFTKLFVQAKGALAQQASSTLGADRAPNAGFGTDYIVQGGPAAPSTCTFRAGEANKTDSDKDCLPDYWEKQYFTNVTAQNATGDPDHDGCNNRCEYLAGTSPIAADTPCVFKAGETNKTDSDKDCLPDSWEMKYFGNVTKQNATGDPDKDGCDNRCEYLAGTDPTVSNQPVVAPVVTPQPSTATKQAAEAAPQDTGTQTAAPLSALGKLQAETGYLVASAAAMGAVVLLSLAGLFGRWGG